MSDTLHSFHHKALRNDLPSAARSWNEPCGTLVFDLCLLPAYSDFCYLRTIWSSSATSCLSFMSTWGLCTLSLKLPYRLPYCHTVATYMILPAVKRGPSSHFTSSSWAACSKSPDGADVSNLKSFCPLLLEYIMSLGRSLAPSGVADSCKDVECLGQCSSLLKKIMDHLLGTQPISSWKSSHKFC